MRERRGTGTTPPDPLGSAAFLDDPAKRLERLETIFRLAPVGIGIVDLDGQTVMSNDTLREMLGYSAEEFATMPWTAFTHPEDIAPNLELFARSQSGEIDHFTMEKRFICKDGTILWAELTSSTVYDAHGQPDYVIGMVQDITERKRLGRELRAAEQRHRLLVERVPAVVYVAEGGEHGRWHYVSPQIEEMLGFTAEEWMADPELWGRQLHTEDRERALEEEAEVSRRGTRGETHSSSYRMHRKDGSVIWVRDDAMALEEHGRGVVWHGVLVDVTREKRLEARLGHQAYHDALTGLPNRSLFHERVGRALERRQRGGGDVAVLFVDLDDFKTVNDSFGHQYGDKVIAAAARRISGCVRSGDTPARLGGDEFGLLVEGVDPDGVTALAERVIGSLRETPIRVDDLTVTVGGSVGIAFAVPGDDTDTLLRNADLAMYRAKRQGRGRHVAYHAELHDEVVHRFRIEEALQAAVAADQITLAYQPIVSLATGEVAGLEALARWHDAELGEVPPAQFIAVAEHNGLIKQLGMQLLEHACAGLVRWRAETGGNAYVSVNVSPLQLDGTCPDRVDDVLRRHGLPPSALVLEVTEGLLLVESSRATIADLRSRGVRVAIDDFGTGYSSLSYLRELPVDIVKIDRIFLQPRPGGPRDQTLLRAIIALAESLHLAVTCEGVETVDQLDDLRMTRCGFAQGYLLARPGPLDDLPAMLPAARVLPGLADPALA